MARSCVNRYPEGIQSLVMRCQMVVSKMPDGGLSEFQEAWAMSVSLWILTVVIGLVLGGAGLFGLLMAVGMGMRGGFVDSLPGCFLVVVCWGMLAAYVASLPGCGGGRLPRSGVVVKKGHRASYTYVVPVVVGKTTVMRPRVMPERWWLGVREDDGEELEVGVEKALWGRTEIGDRWHVQEVE